MKKLKLIIPALLMMAFSFAFVNNVSAYDGWTNVTSITGSRSYIVGQNISTSVSFSSQSIPFTLLSSGSDSYLYGFRLLSINTQSGSYKSYNTVYLAVTLSGQRYWWQDYGNVLNTGFSVTGSNNQSYTGSCSISEYGDTYYQQLCSYSLPKDIVPIRMMFQWGQVGGIDYYTIPLATAENAPLRITYVGWGYNSSDTSETRAINQVNDNINNLNDTITEHYVQEQQNADTANTQASDAQSTADDLGNQFQTGTANLISIIANFYNIIINPPQADCTVPMSQLFGAYSASALTAPDADLCSLSLPPAVGTISSVLMIGLTIPFALLFISFIFDQISWVMGWGANPHSLIRRNK